MCMGFISLSAKVERDHGCSESSTTASGVILAWAPRTTFPWQKPDYLLPTCERRSELVSI